MKLLIWIILFIPFLSFAEPITSDDTPDQLMSKWLDLESQKGRLQSQWHSRKSELERRLELFAIEKDALKAVLEQTSEATSEVDQRRLSLLTVQDELEREQIFVESQIQETGKLAQRLLPRLPPPLQTEWREKMPLLTQEGIGNSEKLERLLGMFKLVEEFDNRVALHRSTMALPGLSGEEHLILVTQIYLGTGQGWYVSDDGNEFGYGRATTLGWNWWHGNKASEELGRELSPQTILKVRAVLENPTTAKFLSLPIKI